MQRPVFFGDEASAAGYRLAGVDVFTPDCSELPGLLQAAGKEASLVMISARLVQCLSEAKLEQLLTSTNPPVMVVPDVSGAVAFPDLATRLRRGLGLLE